MENNNSVNNMGPKILFSCYVFSVIFYVLTKREKERECMCRLNGVDVIYMFLAQLQNANNNGHNTQKNKKYSSQKLFQFTLKSDHKICFFLFFYVQSRSCFCLLRSLGLVNFVEMCVILS